MKNFKLLLSSCVMVLFVLALCDNSQNKNEAKEIVTVTPNLTYGDLQDPVKYCNEVEFDNQGTMVGIGNNDPFSIEQAYREMDVFRFRQPWQLDSSCGKGHLGRYGEHRGV